MRRADRGASFDQLVCPGEKRLRDREAECLGGLQVYDQLELSRFPHRKVRWTGAVEELINVGRGAAKQILIISGERHEAAGGGKYRVRIDRGNSCFRGELDNFSAFGGSQGPRCDIEGIALLAAQPQKGKLDGSACRRYEFHRSDPQLRSAGADIEQALLEPRIIADDDCDSAEARDKCAQQL